MKKLNKKGFTLVELIVVIAIIGILAAVLVPSVTSYIGKAQKSSAQQNAANKYQEYVLALVDVCHLDVSDITCYAIPGEGGTAKPVTNKDEIATKVAKFKGYYVESSGYINLIVNGVVIATEKSKFGSPNKGVITITDTNKGKYNDVDVLKDDVFIVLPELKADSPSSACPVLAHSL